MSEPKRGGLSDEALPGGGIGASHARVTVATSASDSTSSSPAASLLELSGMSNEALMDAYIAGSAPAFERLYQTVAPKLFGYLLRLTRNRERAEDLLQITFGKIHRARASYLRGAPFLPWASAIARRSFYDEVRRARTRREELSFDGQLPEPSAEEQPIPEELQDALEQALDQLPTNYREAIQLTKITGLSMQEAAGVLGTTPTAVKLRVHRGYLALRESLERGLSQKTAPPREGDT